MTFIQPASDGVPDDRSATDFLRAVRDMLVSRAGYRGPPSDHFDGRHFRNLDQPDHHGLLAFLRWRLGRLLGVAPWPKWIDSVPAPPPPTAVEGDRIRVTFVNHATVLLQTAGINVLTDPMWSERASPLPWIGPRRRRRPGIRFRDLPPIHAVLLSHNHYDHLDIPTLRALTRVHSPQFFTGLGNAGLLAREGISPVTELDWWQEAELAGKLGLTCVPARHFSARGIWDRNRTLWCGFVMKGLGGVVCFAGDTAFGSHLGAIAARFGPPRLAILPIAAHMPRWFMSGVHQSPEQAVAAHCLLGARTSVAIHFGTFPLADDGPNQGLDEFAAAKAREGEAANNFWVLDFGEGRDVP